jgi:thiamine kinase-like enzyme
MQYPPELESVIAGIPALSGPAVRQPLGGGPASGSWLIEDRGKLRVLRIDTPLARILQLNRHVELGVLETVAAAGIGPELIWADPEAGLLLTAYIPGQVWSQKNVHDPVCLEQLAGTLRLLHGLSAAGPEFDPAQAALNYAAGIGTTAAAELAAKAVTLARQLLPPGHLRTLCHNDLAHANIIGSNPVRLIDWEYAAVGDPLFDLAVVVRYHQLPDHVTAGFLHACLGPIDAQTSERFDAFCDLYDQLAALWYLAIEVR